MVDIIKQPEGKTVVLDAESSLSAPVDTVTPPLKEGEKAPLKFVDCCKCKKGILEEVAHTLDYRFGFNQILCERCFDSLSIVMNDYHATEYKKFIDRHEKKEPKTYKKFLKGKFDPKVGDDKDGCVKWFVWLMLGLFSLVVAFAMMFSSSTGRTKYPKSEVPSYVDSTIGSSVNF